MAKFFAFPMFRRSGNETEGEKTTFIIRGNNGWPLQRPIAVKLFLFPSFFLSAYVDLPIRNTTY